MISSKSVCTTTLVMFVVIIIKIHGFNFEERVMSDCINAGILCSNHSKCEFDLNKNNFKCFCVAGFMGDLCDEDRNECNIGSAPCRKRGVCHNSIGSFRCDCLPGWIGNHCERSDGSGLSTCVTGYTGVNCTEDFDECTQWQDNPCEHGSTCTNTPGNFSCTCTTGWAGRICNEDINECNLTSGLCHNGGNCTNIPGTYRCDCPYPYTGPACDDVSSTTSTTTSTSTTPTLFSSTGRLNASTNQPSKSNDSLTKSKHKDLGTAVSDQIKTIVGATVGSICGVLLICVSIIAACLYHKHSRVQRKVGTTDGIPPQK